MKKKLVTIIVISILMTVGILTFIPTTTKAGDLPPVAPKTYNVYVGNMWVVCGQIDLHTPYNEAYADAYNLGLANLNTGDTINFYFRYKIIDDQEQLIEKWQFNAKVKINGVTYSRIVGFEEKSDRPIEEEPDHSTPNWVIVKIYSYKVQSYSVSCYTTLTTTYWETDWSGPPFDQLEPTSATDTGIVNLYHN